MYSNFSNSIIMNRNKQVSYSKQETKSVIFMHLSPNLSAPPPKKKNIVWLIWLIWPEIRKIIVLRVIQRRL